MRFLARLSFNDVVRAARAGEVTLALRISSNLVHNAVDKARRNVRALRSIAPAPRRPS